jgi:L-alanine-DL-glutamate epimerase-like enolase superfamily enzyme
VVVGRDPLDIEGIWDAMYATMRGRGHSRGFLLEAISGIDIALWDLLGKRFGLPVARLLGGHGRTKIPVYASSILLDVPEVMAREATRLKAEGYDAIKMKIAGVLDLDIARIQAVREAIGAKTRLMLDANSGYDAASAVTLAEEAQRLGVYWLEEPVYPDNLPGYRRIRASTGIRIAAGEGEFTVSGFRELLQEGLIDVAQPDIARAGGFTGCRRIAALAQSFDIPVAPHTGASGPLCITASMHLSAALSGFLIFEDMFLENPLKAILRDPLPRQSASLITVPTGPGLGVDIDETVFERFTRQATRRVA